MTEQPAHEAVAAVIEEQRNTPNEEVIEIPNMDPDAALEMTKQVIATVAKDSQGALGPEDLPDLSGTNENPELWDKVGGTISADAVGPDRATSVLVIRIIYIPSIADLLVATLLDYLSHAMAVSQRGTEVHEALMRHVTGNPDYTDGLPEREMLEDKEVKTMGSTGSDDNKCPDCGKELSIQAGQVTGHTSTCPRNVQSITTMPADVRTPPPWEKP